MLFEDFGEHKFSDEDQPELQDSDEFGGIYSATLGNNQDDFDLEAYNKENYDLNQDNEDEAENENRSEFDVSVGEQVEVPEFIADEVKSPPKKKTKPIDQDHEDEIQPNMSDFTQR